LLISYSFFEAKQFQKKKPKKRIKKKIKKVLKKRREISFFSGHKDEKERTNCQAILEGDSIFQYPIAKLVKKLSCPIANMF
jgi:hypothetical protein